jgi:ABC-type sugar transport system ATPase subunit
MHLLTVSNISKSHDGELVLNNISFTQSAGQKIAIAGETGSGKTTLMRIVAGLGQADSGNVSFDGQQVKGIYDKLMPGHKGIAYLSQHFELPNKYRVSELMNYANDLTDEASLKLYSVCRIDHLMHRWSQTLSGGEKQRVALARLLTQAPKLLLLDEPYSNMDLIHKLQLKAVIDDVHQQLGVTLMLISHDAMDILPWADEVFVMKDGNIIQSGTPQYIYTQANTLYTAGLFGKYNVLSPTLAAALNLTSPPLCLRPEDIVLSKDEMHGLQGVVQKISYMGSHYEVEMLVGNETLTARTGEHTIQQGDVLTVSLSIRQ